VRLLLRLDVEDMAAQVEAKCCPVAREVLLEGSANERSLARSCAGASELR